MAQPNWPEILSNAMASSLGIKVGPGVLLVVGWVAACGLLAAGAAIWALHEQPLLAIVSAALILAVTVYFCERAFRYAIKNPIPALMGGAELLKVIEHQMAASDKALVKDGDGQDGQIGGTQNALESKPIEGKPRSRGRTD